ncbi:MAG TPA: hypothetical protein VMB48_14105 [Steroidobacteraceae bacterium]|nr:hypothetical protein [Steroidobacteraceae bacterium]
MSTTPPDLRADCTRCCGLCCVAPAFYADQGFGFDKPAHQPCTHLGQDFRCAVHEGLARHGFPACAVFDCHGAGQRVTRLFGGRSWSSSPELAPRMFDAYRRYRVLHELMAMLSVAIERASPPDAVRLADQRQLLEQLCESGAALEDTCRTHVLREQVLAHIRGALRPTAGTTPDRRTPG